MPERPKRKPASSEKDAKLLKELTDIKISPNDKLNKARKAFEARKALIKTKTLSKLPKKPVVSSKVKLTKAIKKTIKEFKKVGVTIDLNDLDANGVLKKGTKSYKAAMAYVTKVQKQDEK